MSEIAQIDAALDLSSLPSVKDAFQNLARLDPGSYRKLKLLFPRMPLLKLLDEILNTAKDMSDLVTRQALLDLAKLTIARHDYTRELFLQLAALVMDSRTELVDGLLAGKPVQDAKLVMQMLDLMAELLALAGKQDRGLYCYKIAELVANQFGLALNHAIVLYQLGCYLAECGLFTEAGAALRSAANEFEPVAPQLARKANLLRVSIYCYRLRSETDLALPDDLQAILAGEPEAEQRILLTHARNALDRYDLDEARSLCDQVRARWKIQGPLLAELLLIESRVARRQGYFEEADLLLKQGTKLVGTSAERTGSQLAEELQWEKFYLARDLGLKERASTLLSQLQEAKDTVRVEYQKALVAFQEGTLVEAEKLFQRCLEMSSDDDTRADSYGMLGELFISQKKWEEARRYIYRAISLYFKLGNKLDHAIALSNLAAIEADGGEDDLLDNTHVFMIDQFARAEELLNAAKKMAEDLGAEDFLLDLQINQARLDWHRGRFDTAMQLFGEALTHFELIYLSLTGSEHSLAYISKHEQFYSEALFCAIGGNRLDEAFIIGERSKARRFLRDVAERSFSENVQVTNPLLREEGEILASVEPLRRKLNQGRPLTVDERQSVYHKELRLVEIWRQLQETAQPEELARNIRQPLTAEMLRHIVFQLPLDQQGPRKEAGRSRQKPEKEPQVANSFGGGGVIVCPRCFVHNVISSSYCSVCEQMLPRSASVNLSPMLGEADEEELKQSFADYLYNKAVRAFHDAKVDEADGLLAQALQYQQHPDYSFFYGLCRLVLDDPAGALVSFTSILPLQYAGKYPFWPLPVSPGDFRQNVELLRQNQTQASEVFKNLLQCYQEYLVESRKIKNE